MTEKRDLDQLEKAPAPIAISDTPSGSFNDEEHDPFDTEYDRKILRKIDYHIIPFVAILYLLSFLDRSNIGNAKILGLVKDIGLKGLQYNVCAAVFFITYSVSEVPSNIMLKLTRPSIWIMLAWGIVMTLMCLVNSYNGMIIARLFLGLTEGGLFPGVNFFLTLWYRRKEQAFRIAVFFSAATIAGAFGGLLAAAIAKLNGRAGLHGWQWIFLIEGLITVVVSIIAYFFMQDYPGTARFLTEDERAHVVERLRRDHPGLATHVDKRFVWQAFKDYRAYLFTIMYTGILISLYAFSLFLPTIINGLGYTANEAQLMSVPPYVAGCICTVGAGWISDKYHKRGPFLVGFACLAITGYAILLGTTSPGAGYTGAMIAALGVFPTIPLAISWIGSNIGGDLKRGVVLAMVIGIGNLGGICSSFIFIAAESPRFYTGHGVCIGVLVMTTATACFLMWDFRRLNKKKEDICAREGIDKSRSAQFSEMGDDSPLFRYAICLGRDGFDSLPTSHSSSSYVM
ncbi:hypothetical protein M407DRAFT_64294 [Tulasnella calospora MUT 4182]|uniref:Major facilitator superfamily (MFS) profile domain-containing protein n=1 Tax=Tulasnella calospora MUT 4182 TaxID=1051891 RepID=A0A0C3QWR6_9AGAM|nr:hypothetical protein M407DRAFT_64294 [Tulasnella calospora MUT 4182]